MPPDELPEFAPVLLADGLEADHLEVAVVLQFPVRIEDPGDAAAHAGREVAPGRPKNHGAAAGHVLAAVIADPLDDRAGARVADAEALRGAAAEERFAAGGAVERDVADQDVLFGDESGAARRVEDEPSAGQPLADVVVAVALQLDRDAGREEGAEALAGAAGERDVDRVVGQAVLAARLHQLVAEHRADGALGVHDGQVDPYAGTALERRPGPLDQLVVERVLERVVLFDRLHHFDVVVPAHRGLEHRRQVETFRLLVPNREFALEQVGPSDQLPDRRDAEVRHDSPRLLGDEEEVVHDLLRRAFELGAQLRILGGDADRAGVQVALAHHDAADRDQRRGGEAELLGAQHAGDGDVAAGLELAVGLEDHPRTQVAQHQRLVGLGDAEFPGQAGVLDAGQRRSAGAAVVARDQDVVGVRLGDARGDRPHADLGHELHADPRTGVGVLQIVDELLQVLDRVDVVVGRRRDEPHSGCGVAGPGDDLVDLVARQFSAFARLGALGDLDLELVRVGQVPGGDAEAARRDLLDRRAAEVAVGVRREARRILAALAGVALAAEAVHRDGERLVALGRDRAEAHRARAEALDDLARRFHRVERQGFEVRAELEQAAQRAFPGGVLVGEPGEALVGLRAVRAGRVLEPRDHLRVPHVAFAAGAPVVVARVREFGDAFAVVGGEAAGVTLQRVLRQPFETGALDPAGGAGEAAVDHFRGQSDRLEDLGALVALERRDAHLGHHLEHPLPDALAVAVDDGLVVGRGGQPALAARLPERLEGQVGVDRVRAVADQQAVVVDLAGLAALEQETDPGALDRPQQVVVDGAAGEQRRHRDAVGSGRPVGEGDEGAAVVDRLLGFPAKAVERVAEPRGALFEGPGGVERAAGEARVPGAGQRRELPVAQDRMGQPDAQAVVGGRLEQVALGADRAVDRHDDLLADRVDRRVRDLGEELLEVVVDRAVLVGEEGEGGVVAHRADRIALLLDQGPQHEAHRLAGVAEGLEAPGQCVVVHRRLVREGVPVACGMGDQVGQVGAAFEPLRVRPLRGDAALQLLVGDDAAEVEVDQEHPAGLEPPLAQHPFRLDRDDAGLRRHDDQVVVRDVVAAGAKAVAVEHGADVAAVGEGDRGRSVPGLHQAGVVVVERPLRSVHVRVVLPRLRDHHHDRLLEGAAREQEELEHVVEAAGVRAVGLDDREGERQIVAEEVALQHAFAGVHPVHVAAQRVDLAVVAHEAVRLRAVPGRERVRGEARVDHRQVGLVVRRREIREERHELAGGQHALVDDHAGRQRTDVEHLRLGEGFVAAQADRRLLADQVELALEGVLVESVGGSDEELLDDRHGIEGGGADVGDLGAGRHLAPADQFLPAFRDDLLHDTPAQLAFAVVLGQEEDAGREGAGRSQFGPELVRRDPAQQGVRQSGQHAGAVAAVRLAAAGAAVVHPGQHVGGLLHQPVAALAAHVGDEADSAGVVLVGRVVQADLSGTQLHAASPCSTISSSSPGIGPAFSTRNAAKSSAAARSRRRAKTIPIGRSSFGSSGTAASRPARTSARNVRSGRIAA